MSSRCWPSERVSWLGGVYFCAPAGMIADHVRAMAEKRGFCGNSKLNWLTVMDAGSRVRVGKYIEAAQKKGICNFVSSRTATLEHADERALPPTTAR